MNESKDRSSKDIAGARLSLVRGFGAASVSRDGQDVCHVETYDETYRGEDEISDKTFDGTECTLDK